MANMHKQDVRTDMDKAWGMRARRAGVGGTGCKCRKPSEREVCSHLCRRTLLLVVRPSRLTCNGARANFRPGVCATLRTIKPTLKSLKSIPLSTTKISIQWYPFPTLKSLTPTTQPMTKSSIQSCHFPNLHQKIIHTTGRRTRSCHNITNHMKIPDLALASNWGTATTLSLQHLGDRALPASAQAPPAGPTTFKFKELCLQLRYQRLVTRALHKVSLVNTHT